MSESEKLPRVQLRSFQKLDCNFNERDGVFVHHKALVLFALGDRSRSEEYWRSPAAFQVGRLCKGLQYNLKTRTSRLTLFE